MEKKTGRPPNQQDTEDVRFTVPTLAAGYLRYLAKNTMLGATPNDVAALILTNELMRMAKEEAHKLTVPQA